MKAIYIRTTILLLLLSCNLVRTTAQGLWAVQVTDFKAESRNGNINLTWKSGSEQNLLQYEIEYSPDGRYYRNLGFIHATNRLNGDIYEFQDHISYTDSGLYRLKIVDVNGKSLYTDPVLYRINKITAFSIYPNIITTGMLNIFLNDPFEWLQVVSSNGTVMLRENLSGKTGRINIPVSPTVAPGTYIVQIGNYDKVISQKVIIQ